MENLQQLLLQSRDKCPGGFWDTQLVHQLVLESQADQTLRSTERMIEQSGLLPVALKLDDLTTPDGQKANQQLLHHMDADYRKKRFLSFAIQIHQSDEGCQVLFCNDGRGGRRWIMLENDLDDETLKSSLVIFAGDRDAVFWPHGDLVKRFKTLFQKQGSYTLESSSKQKLMLGSFVYSERADASFEVKSPDTTQTRSREMTHLDRLEAESIHIMREVVSQAENPVMLYSIGKDSSVMLHLARKAFYPQTPPFPLMHVDTRWKFKAMYDFRDQMTEALGMESIVHINPDGVAKNINPFDHGSALHTDIMKTEGLKQALDQHGFDVAFGGARRDEEKSRAKERIFSFRTETHRWDPKNQRPEVWNLFNGYKRPGESIRVFPLSNWTELDIWEYIYRESIPIVPLYFSAERPVIERDGMLMLVDDDRLPLLDSDKVELKRVRFRTLGCYPLTGAIESDADDLSSIVLELLRSKTSERQGRAIDQDSSGSMEKKKLEGYF